MKERRVVLNRQYQNTAAEAIREFEQLAVGSGEPVQLLFPIEYVVSTVRQGLGELIRRVGVMFACAVMEEEVERRVGAKSQPNQARNAYRWGTEKGYCIVDGQRIPLPRPRIRSVDGSEIRLGSYELFQKAPLMEETVWLKIMQGLTMRSYKDVVKQFGEAYGMEKSTISEYFIEASRKKLEILMSRSFSGLEMPVMIVDGTIFRQENLVVAIGIDAFGNKHVLGLQQGATENVEVVTSLLEDLQSRGIDFNQPRLYVLDGNQALRRAIVKFAGQAAFIQRCQVHKIRNVTRHLPESRAMAVKFRMRAAYNCTGLAEAREALENLHDELMEVNTCAARSLAEGLDQTLMVHQLGITGVLRQTLSSTNAIESSFSVVEGICNQVKRWQGSDHRLRWVGSSLMYLQGRWNRLHGYKQMPGLIRSLRCNYQARLQDNQPKQKKAAAA